MALSVGTEEVERRLLELLADRAPQRLRARLEDPLRVFGDAVALRIVEGQLLDARIGRRENEQALLVLALADRLTLESAPEQPSSSRVGPSFRGLWTEARSQAAQIHALLSPLGGLEAQPRATGPQPPGLPEAAQEIFGLIDGQRSTAGILAAAHHELLLTARILVRLFEVEAAVVPPLPVESAPTPVFEPPSSGWGQSSILPDEEEEVEGEAVIAQVQAWLGPNSAASISTGEAFRSVFLEDETPTPVAAEPPARVQATVPVAPPAVLVPLAPPPRAQTPPPDDGPLDSFGRRQPREEEEGVDDAALAREAGVSRAPLVVLLMAAVGIALAALILAVGRDPPVVEKPAPPPPPPPPVQTATIARTSTRGPEIIDGRPAIAGPDAPAEVKRAEQLLNRGAYAEAEALLDQLRETLPKDPAVLTLAGQLCVDTRRLGPAGDLADQALAADPKFYRAWVLKGSVAQFRGQNQAAGAAYQKAIALEPGHPMTPEIQSVLQSLNH